MTRLVGVELLKLRTMRVTYGLLAAAVAVTALFASLEASRAGRSVPPASTAVGLGEVTTVSGVAMILAAVLGVIVTSGEFRHTSATLTYLATPDRRRVLVTKAVATALVGACYGIAARIVATVVGLAFVSGDDDHVTLGAAPLVGHIAGTGAGAALLGAVGVAVGSLIRAQLAGVIGAALPRRRRARRGHRHRHLAPGRADHRPPRHHLSGGRRPAGFHGRASRIRPETPCCGRRGVAAYRTRSQRTQAVAVSGSSLLVGGRTEVGCSTGRVSVMRRP
jgi:ABC-2 type transport system permease protein